MRGITLAAFILLVFNVAFGGELVLKGKYNGKNVFVRNPYNAETEEFCTINVYVNDRLILEGPQLSAFQIDLSYLNQGALVVVRIEYRDDCQPVVMNPTVLSFNAGFQFLSSHSDNNSINWTTIGELPGGEYQLEQLFKKGGWKTIKSFEAKGAMNINQYSIEPNHFPGENHYRVGYKDSNGNQYYSVEIMYTSTDDPITFSPEIVTTSISLSKATQYAILDMNDNEIRKGSGKEIELQDLRPGEYYLFIENRKERFVKQ